MIFCLKRDVSRPKIKSVNVTSVLFAGKIEIGPAILQKLFAKSCAVIFESIRPEMKPNKIKGIGRIIGVLKLEKTVERMARIV